MRKMVIILIIICLLISSGCFLLWQRIRFSVFKSPVPTPFADCWTKDKCAQMSTCKEAFHFLTHCQKKRLDGDKDGIPCEKLCKKSKM